MALGMSMGGWPCGNRNSGNRALKMDLDSANREFQVASLWEKSINQAQDIKALKCHPKIYDLLNKDSQVFLSHCGNLIGMMLLWLHPCK